MTTQKDYLQATKTALGAKTWDALAQIAGVAPRALKTYRMPESSDEYRGMSKFVKQAFESLLAEKAKKKVK